MKLYIGTAGVWRISAIDEAGGWNHRTTVEDMDLAVRASLKGWKFLYLDSLRVKNELPSTFKALRYQQHRWSCGPANLFRKVFMEIVRNENVNLLKKINIVYSFFFVRKVICHVGTFMFYCVVLPTTCLVPEVDVPKWGAIYIPFIVTLINSVGTPRMYILELVIGAYLLFCGSYDLFLGKRQYCWYIILQSFAFFIAGFGYIGTYLPTS
nr:glucomannan 4-beta-mannosyltransferase 9-like [Ipomoea batatas]